jgi:hypothetical protein
MKIYYADKPALCGTVDEWLEGETWPVGNNTFGIKLDDGKFLSVQPDASYQERDAVGGSYEMFTLDPSINVLIVQPRTATYKIPYRER